MYLHDRKKKDLKFIKKKELKDKKLILFSFAI